MSKDDKLAPENRDRTDEEKLSERLDGIGWGLFLIWVGFAFLFDIGWGWGLLGIAAIILGEVAYRWKLDLKIERFWAVAGIVFLAGGLWELFRVPVPLAPILIMFCGAAVLWGVFTDRQLMKK